MTIPSVNVISLALFSHPKPRYNFANCLPAVVRGYAACYPGWRVRIHHDDSIFSAYYGDVLLKLADEKLIDLVACGKVETLCGSMLWRIKPASDPSVSRFLCRDIDAMPSAREAAAVQDWIDSGLAVHIIHDSTSHTLYMGGMMGFRGDALREAIGPDPYEIAIQYASDDDIDLDIHGADQRVLNRLFKARLASSTFCSFDPEKLAHAEFRVAKPIPKRNISDPRDRASESIGTPFDRVGAIGVYAEASKSDSEFAKAISKIVDVERSLYLNEQAYGTPPHRHVVTSSNLNHDYAFYAPIVTAMWMRLGYRPIIFLVGGAEEWKSHRFGSIALSEARKRGAVIHFVDRVDGYPESASAQVVRLMGAYTPLVREDDYLMTTDIDMLPLSREFWSSPLGNGHRVDVYFANAYEGEQRPHWPICYIGMTAASWVLLLGSYANHNEALFSCLRGNLLLGDVAKDPMLAWCFDEYFISKKIADVAKSGDWAVRFIDRRKAPGGWPASRIDRGAWEKSYSANVHGGVLDSGAVDCHAPRPGYEDLAWARVHGLLEAFERGLGDSFAEYRMAFAAAV